MSDLLPCPFCGGTKFQRNTKAKSYFVKRQAAREGRDTSNHIVRCTGCGAKGPLMHSMGEAGEAWNHSAPVAMETRRAETTGSVGAVDDSAGRNGTGKRKSA